MTGYETKSDSVHIQAPKNHKMSKTIWMRLIIKSNGGKLTNKQQQAMMDWLKRRKWNWFGHTLRSDDSIAKQALHTVLPNYRNPRNP